MFPRTRLFRVLDRARKRPLVWVSGPPGAGKTTVVGSYVARRKLRCLWYQFDEDDADVATFFHYFGLAAKQAAPRMRASLPHLTPEYRPGLSTFTRRYFRDLYGRLPLPFVLVFDNHQQVPVDSVLHDVLQEGVREIPRGGRVIVISRSAPPPRLARLRASQSLALLDANDLRLTAAEARGIARLRGHIKLPNATLRHLHHKTKGWAAGLVLMLESMRTEGRAVSPVHAGTLQATFDYFAAEIFQRSSHQTQGFLLQTAFLGRMTAAMATALTGARDAARRLADLNRAHYFTEKHVEADPVYEYHPLFREFLLARAKETFTAARCARVQRRAAALLVAAGQVEDAVDLLRAAGDWREMARQILAQAPTLMAQGRSQTLQQWLEGLPKTLIERNAWLRYWLGVCCLAFAPREARQHFERAFAAFKAEQDPAGLYLSWSGVVEGFLYEWDDFTPVDRWIAALDELLRRFPQIPSVEIEARVTLSMFNALKFRQPQHPQINAWADRALALARRSADVSQRMFAAFHVGHYRLWTGDLAAAAAAIDLLREWARAPDVSPLALMAWRGLEATYSWYTGSYASCRDAVNAGLAIARTTGVTLWVPRLLSEGVMGALGAGDLASARALLHDMAAALPETQHLEIGLYHYLSAREALQRRDLSRALRDGELGLRTAVELGTPFPEAVNQLNMAQVRHARAEHRKAVAHLARARRIGRAMHSRVLQYAGLLVAAHFAVTQGREARGLRSLRQAFALDREQEYAGAASWHPAEMGLLCAKALEAGVEVDYVQALVRKRNLVPPESPIDIDAWPWAFRVYTLGRFAVVKNGQPLQFSRKVQQKPLALLKAVIALGGQNVPEGQLADALWPAAEGDMAHRDFATTLHRLRRLLAQTEMIVLREGRVSVDPHYCWVDSWAFEHLLRQAEAAEKRGSTDTAVQLTERALELYQGPFLGADAGEPWGLSLRERLRNKFLRHTGKLGRHWEHVAEWRRAVECYERGLDVDDLAEEFYQRLMACHQRLGRQAEALAVYLRCRRTLAATLGVAPSAATETLRRQLLTS